MYKQGSGYGFHLMGNRLKQQKATKTYEVRSGSLYTQKIGTLILNMKQVCKRRRVGKGINSLPSVKAGCNSVFAHLYICEYAIVRSTRPNYIYSSKKAINRTKLSCSVSRNSQALAKKEAYLKRAAKRSKPTSSKLTHFMFWKEFTITAPRAKVRQIGLKD